MLKKRIEKYFEVVVGEARTWDFRDYALFVVESMYSTILPFIAGVQFVARGQIIWILFLILPLYLRMRLLKRFEEKPKTRKIYVKED